MRSHVHKYRVVHRSFPIYFFSIFLSLLYDIGTGLIGSLGNAGYCLLGKAGADVFLFPRGAGRIADVNNI